jgi:hypothetical protein
MPFTGSYIDERGEKADVPLKIQFTINALNKKVYVK